jgi:homoserine dehydrogenase
MINIGLLGLGHVGTGVFEILNQKADLIFNRTGKKLFVKTVVDRNESKRELAESKGAIFSTNSDDILNDPDINVVVEVLGGEQPAFDFICKALKNKKHVVTANKEVVAKHKTIFFKLAKENNVDIYYEASVGGGIPLIRSLKVGFAANKIKSIYGILNGTTNYILTKIAEEHKTFDEVLKTAQELGFAEANPTMDVSGLDVAYKLVILAAVAFKLDINLDQLYFEGIENITVEDMSYAEEIGYTIKLLAIGKDTEEGTCFKVHPTMIPKTHPLAGVRNEFNALFIDGDSVGESMLFGKGAGPLPTGSAVVSDIIDIAFNSGKSISRRNLEANIESKELLKIDDTVAQFYMRILAKDAFGVLEHIAGILGKNNVGILKVIQKDRVNDDAVVVIVTHKVKEKNFNVAINELKNTDIIKKVFSVIRVGLDEE